MFKKQRNERRAAKLVTEMENRETTHVVAWNNKKTGDLVVTYHNKAQIVFSASARGLKVIYRPRTGVPAYEAAPFIAEAKVLFNEALRAVAMRDYNITEAE